MAGNIKDAIEAIKQSTPDSKVYVGCDSIRYKKRINGKMTMYACYATVVILHMGGRHGGKIFYDVEDLPDYGNIKQRMLTEVGFACQHFATIADHLDGRYCEIHCDINKDPHHKSNVALTEARGWILGTFGFEPKFKPDGFAATHAADWIAHHRS